MLLYVHRNHGPIHGSMQKPYACDFVPHGYETLKWLSSLPTLMQKSFWWWQCSDRYIFFPLHPPPFPLPLFSPSLICLMVSVDVKHHVYLLTVCLLGTGAQDGHSTCTQLLSSVETRQQGDGEVSGSRHDNIIHGVAQRAGGWRTGAPLSLPAARNPSFV